MSLIGLIFLALAAAAVLRSQTMALCIFAIAALFQAASAFTIGPANVTPGHFVLLFLAIAVCIRQGGLATTLNAYVYPRAGFYLVLITLWAVASAILLPRLFAGAVQVMPLNARGGYYVEGPLYPVSSNINQAVYAIGNLAAFGLAYSLGRSQELLVKAGCALLIACGFNFALAAIDSATFSAGVPHLLEFIRNADYAQAFEQTIAGMKRMNGSFPEPSVFAGVSVGLFGFAFGLWRGSVFSPYSGWIAIALFVAILLAFSTTGYVALAVYMIVVYSLNLLGIVPGAQLKSAIRTRRNLVISFLPIAAIIGAIVVALRPDLLDPVVEIFDTTIVNKASSDSGVERASWNMGGVRVFFETVGLGAGLGSIRTSSFLVSIAASLGVLGVIGFSVLFGRLFLHTPRPRVGSQASEVAVIQAAARSACFGLLIGASLSSAVPDLGLMFFIFAGIASAEPAPSQRLPVSTA